MFEIVKVIRTDHDGVVEVRLNRPEKMNAISTAKFSGCSVLSFLLLFCFFASARADTIDELYQDLVDRQVSESQIGHRYPDNELEKFDLNRVFTSQGGMDDSLLRISVYRGFEKVTARLVELGANPDLVLEKNCSPLGTAIANENDKLIQLLIEAGADTGVPVCWPQNGSKDTPLDLAITIYDISDDSRKLIMRNYVEDSGKLTRRILLYAIVNDRPEIARLFLDLMPGFQDERMESLAQNRSKTIYDMLVGQRQ